MKKKIGTEFYIDEDCSQKADWCNVNDCHIEEIESDCDKRKFKIVQNEDRTLETEYYTLLDWFDNVYTYQEQKYRRLVALNKLDDDGIDAQTKLNELYIEAEEKRKRIQEIEKRQ